MTPLEYKNLRESLGTQAEVADMLGVNRVTVAKRENGSMTITNEAVIAIQSLRKPKRARDHQRIIRLGVADYKCNCCGKVVQRDFGWKVWTSSFCETTGKNARLYRISVPSIPNGNGSHE